MATKNYSYIGKGTIYFRERGASAGLLPIGNCSALELAAEEEKQTQQDFTQAGGGLANTVSQISAVTMAMTVLDISAKNIALAMRGSYSEITSAEVTDERHTAYLGALVPFEFQPDKTATITVTTDPDGTPTPAVLDTDYEITNAGIRILEDTTTIADGDEIAVTYTKTAASVVEALTESGKEFELVFDGLNEAQSGKAVTVKVHRIKLSPGEGLSLLGNEFAELPVTGDVLSDSSVVGTGISRFFKVQMQE